VQPFTPGVSCDRCGETITGAPLVTALSGPDGRFTLKGVPAGEDIPLVIQIGRWRRQIKIQKVTACATQELPAELTRLPRNHTEGEIPLMAIGAGQYDPLECILRKIGIDDSEFTLPSGKGRVHLFTAGSEALPGSPAARTLTGSPETLARYDFVALPCNDTTAPPSDDLQNLRAYTDKGGRLFLTDLSQKWLRDMGPFEGTAQWPKYPLTVVNALESTIDQSFPKGMAFAAWLSNVKASLTPGKLNIEDPIGAMSVVNGPTPPSQRWIYTDNPPGVELYSFNTPIGKAAAEQCGRVVFSAFHVVHQGQSTAFPAACSSAPLTPQEKALEFMLFDVASCVEADSARPSVFAPPPAAPPLPPPR
jgi:hypothetical protein